MDVKTLGIDLGKNVFHVVGLNERGAIALKRRLSRTQLAVLVGNLPRCVVGMEACPGSHHMARRLEEHGHTVRLLPPQYVRPYVKTNKNDFRDAEAIAEAVGRGTMRFVPPKTLAQLDLQAL
jgi:transposase